MLKYPANHIRVLDQADDPHLRTALRAGQWIDLPDLFDKLPSGSGWYPPRLVIRYVQYGEIHAVLFSRQPVFRSRHPFLAPLPHGPAGIPAIVTHHLKALFRDMLRNPGYELPCRKQFEVLLVLANIRSTWQHQEGDNLRPQLSEIVTRVEKSDFLSAY